MNAMTPRLCACLLALATLAACAGDGDPSSGEPPQATLVAPQCGATPLKPTTHALEGQVDGASATTQAFFDVLGPAPVSVEAELDASGHATASVTLERQGTWSLQLRVEDPRGEALSEVMTCVVANAAPAVIFEAPLNASTFNEEEVIPLVAQVSDPDDDATSLTVTFSSSTDGVLGAVSPDADGVAVLEVSGLSVFNHLLSVSAADPWGGTDDASITVEITECHDRDGDGFTDCYDDCADHDPAINAGAEEVCDGVDNDCNGSIDELGDADGDGAPRCDPACVVGAEPGACDLDCDDLDPAVGPGQSEVCAGEPARDEDCDGLVDESADLDADGVSTCAVPPDCDDADPSVAPGLDEVCDGKDTDCDGVVDEGLAVLYWKDGDQDGYGDPQTPNLACPPTIPVGYVEADGGAAPADCDDTDAAINPAAEEGCDGRDEDCDGAVDEGFPLTTFYLDSDGDGFGDDGAPVEACLRPPGAADAGGDCDDADAATSPASPETCDLADDDCDGQVDEGAQIPLYPDADGDGFGDDALATPGCAPGEGQTAQGGDCDDADPLVSPAAVEVCDERDEDCDGQVDDGVTTTFYLDSDGDGWGDAAATAEACEKPPGYADRPGDCGPGAPAVYPGADERCDERDGDCDGQVDEGVQLSFYPDQDGDGVGGDGDPVLACAPPAGTAAADGDCDDADPATFPGATEACDGADNDCDGILDNGLELDPFYLDADGDGWGADSGELLACAAPEGYVGRGGDCRDGNPNIHPGATERCDERDEDCDGGVDEGVQQTFYADEDDDGHGDPQQIRLACALCADCAASADDCDDHHADTYPGAPERFDGRDNDCDGAVERTVAMAAAHAIFTGAGDGAQAGAAIAGPFDLNGDGTDDLAFSAPGESASKGTVHVFYGRAAGWGSGPAASANVTFTGDASGDLIGISLAALDLDRDGTGDLAIGSPWASPLPNRAESGRISVIYGGRPVTTGALSQAQDAFLVGDTAYRHLGASLAAGDVSCDGRGDLIIGGANGEADAPSAVKAGGVWILPGKDGAYTSITGAISQGVAYTLPGKSGEVLGDEVAFLGDLDQDGCGDLLAVARGSEGRGPRIVTDFGALYLVPGDERQGSPGSTAIQDAAAATWKGATPGDRAGWRSDGPGDVDGDGVPDLIVGRLASQPGQPLAGLIAGGSPLPADGPLRAAFTTAFTAGASDIACPCVVAGLGDVNGDGLGDLAIGTPQAPAGGRVFIFFGRPSGLPATLELATQADVTLIATSVSDYTGFAIAGVGDVNGDGAYDFAVGAPAASVGPAGSAGRVSLFFGY